MSRGEWIATLIISVTIAFACGFWIGHGSMRKLLEYNGYAAVCYPAAGHGEGHWVVYYLESCGEVE